MEEIFIKETFKRCKMLKNLTVSEFIEKTSSKDPVPGGGSVAALCGAIGSALTQMVANLTTGKKKYLDVTEVMDGIILNMEGFKNAFVDFIDEDAKAFDKVMAAYKLPKETEEQIEYKNAQIQENLKLAALVPMNVARKSLELIPTCKIVVESGNSNAVTDGMVAAMLCRTALLSASLNVKINLNSIDDTEFVNKLRNELITLETEVVRIEKEILDSVNL
jgi:formiminotetrahydrofolate cyclodeaminase